MTRPILPVRKTAGEKESTFITFEDGRIPPAGSTASTFEERTRSEESAGAWWLGGRRGEFPRIPRAPQELQHFPGDSRAKGGDSCSEVTGPPGKVAGSPCFAS